MDALRINPDGEIEHLQLQVDDGELAALRAALDCDRVECLSLGLGLGMWLDNHGYGTREANRPATALADMLLGRGAPQVYYGPVLVLGVREETGDLADVPLDAGTLAHLRPAVH